MKTERLEFIKKQAVATLELTKGLAPEQRNRSVQSLEELSGYILEIANEVWESDLKMYVIRQDDNNEIFFVAAYSEWQAKRIYETEIATFEDYNSIDSADKEALSADYNEIEPHRFRDHFIEARGAFSFCKEPAILLAYSFEA